MVWFDIRLVLILAAMTLSLAFLVMGSIRYYRDKLAGLDKIWLQRSFAAYASHPLPLVAALGLRYWLDFEGGGPALVASLCLTLLLLIVSAYFGSRSRSAAGGRFAVAGGCMFAVYLMSDVFGYS